MLIIFLTILVLFTFPSAFLRDRFFGTFYGFLFIYFIFSIVGYQYFPGYSESIQAYFGYDVGFEATVIVLASMILIFLASYLVPGRFFPQPFRERQIILPTTDYPLGVLLSYGMLVGFIVFSIIYFEQLSWYVASEDSIPVGLRIFIQAFKCLTGIVLSYYVLFRHYGIPRWRAHLVPAIGLAAIFLFIAFRLGNRTDLAALVLGILIYESLGRRLTAGFLVRALILGILMVGLLSVVEHLRYDDLQRPTADVFDRFIKNDYFAPAHVMFAAIAFNYVAPDDVLLSNFSNALAFLQYPYLQENVMDLFLPGLASRTSSYAFYVLGEGYIAVGLAAPFYNAAVLTVFTKMWSGLTVSRDPFLAKWMTALCASMAINLVRGQTSYFIKYSYTYLLPVIIIFIVVIGLRIVSSRRVEAER